MYKNDAMSEKAKILARKIRRRIRRQPYQEVTEIVPFFNRENPIYGEKDAGLSEPLVKLGEPDNDDCATSPWKIRASSNIFLFLLRWPITFTLWCTIPDSRRFKKFYVLTFMNCVLWIGCISFSVVFITTDVGEWIFVIKMSFDFNFGSLKIAWWV